MTEPVSSRPRASAGFTLIEVMLALVVFVVGVVGMTAMQSRGIEAQRAAVEIREAERVGQRIMADLQSRGFGELVTTDFGGGGNSPPYEDSITTRLLVDMSAPPVDDPLNVERPGVREQFFAVYRSVDPVPAGPWPRTWWGATGRAGDVGRHHRGQLCAARHGAGVDLAAVVHRPCRSKLCGLGSLGRAPHRAHG